jgi:hypothetical protein
LNDHILWLLSHPLKGYVVSRQKRPARLKEFSASNQEIFIVNAAVNAKDETLCGATSGDDSAAVFCSGVRRR